MPAVPGPWDRLRSVSPIARERGAQLLARGASALAGRGPVIVPEYSFESRARWGWDDPPPPALVDTLDRYVANYPAEIDRAVELSDWCPSVTRSATDAAAGEPAWDNEYWGGLDAVVQVAALRARQPARYLEVGSGWSTRFARRAVRDFGLSTTIVSIDPAPRADVDAICDEVVRQPLEQADLAVFGRLGPGDVLLVDGSHLALMNSDATVLLGEVLPALPAGVLVGIDDVFLPWDYPPTWAGRFYGEQYLLAALLLGGASGWNVRFPGWYLTKVSSLADRFAPLWPTVETRFGRHATSFWMERTG